MPFGQGRSGGGGRGRGDKKDRDKEQGQRRPMFRRRKVCKFCADKIDDINYKDVKLLGPFVPERGKILPRRISGTCAMHQRKLQTAIKRARQIALIPVRDGLRIAMEVILERTRRQPRAPRRDREGRRRLRAQLPAAAQAGAAGDRRQQEADRARARQVRREGSRREEGRRGASPTRLASVEVVIARKVGETEALYGSVTTADIAEALAAKGFDIDRRKLQLAEPIKKIGDVDVPVKLHRDVTAQLKVRVVPEGTA